MLWWTFQNAIVTALMAALVWLAARPLRLSPAARHALWLLVLLKFLTPPLVAWPWAISNPLRNSQPRQEQTAATLQPEIWIQTPVQPRSEAPALLPSTEWLPTEPKVA